MHMHESHRNIIPSAPVLHRMSIILVVQTISQKKEFTSHCVSYKFNPTSD